MWLRVCRRTAPLSTMLEALGRVEGVERSELYVSVDCRDWEAVLRVLANVTFTTVRLYFHSLANDSEQLLFPRTEAGGTQFHHVIKLNSHYLWGLYVQRSLSQCIFVTFRAGTSCSTSTRSITSLLWRMTWSRHVTFSCGTPTCARCS